jgi:hypothetical protein
MQDGRLDEQGAYPRLLATLGVVVAGTALVRSAPPGPGKHQFYTAGWRRDSGIQADDARTCAVKGNRDHHGWAEERASRGDCGMVEREEGEGR